MPTENNPLTQQEIIPSHLTVLAKRIVDAHTHPNMLKIRMLPHAIIESLVSRFLVLLVARFNNTESTALWAVDRSSRCQSDGYREYSDEGWELHGNDEFAEFGEVLYVIERDLDFRVARNHLQWTACPRSSCELKVTSRYVIFLNFGSENGFRLPALTDVRIYPPPRHDVKASIYKKWGY